MDHKGWLASGGIGEGAEGRAKQGIKALKDTKAHLVLSKISSAWSSYWEFPISR
jgi:hypothetical protein